MCTVPEGWCDFDWLHCFRDENNDDVVVLQNCLSRGLQYCLGSCVIEALNLSRVSANGECSGFCSGHSVRETSRTANRDSVSLVPVGNRRCFLEGPHLCTAGLGRVGRWLLCCLLVHRHCLWDLMIGMGNKPVVAAVLPGCTWEQLRGVGPFKTPHLLPLVM